MSPFLKVVFFFYSRLSSMIEDNFFKKKNHTKLLKNGFYKDKLKSKLNYNNLVEKKIFTNNFFEKLIIDKKYIKLIIDNIFLENNIDIKKIIITKIDVEGVEEAVLNGSKKFLELNTAPILLEYRNDIMQRDLNSDLKNVCDLLNNLDYEIYSIDKNYLLDKFIPNNSYENIIAIKLNSDLQQYLK